MADAPAESDDLDDPAESGGADDAGGSDPAGFVAAGRVWRRDAGQGPHIVVVHGTMDRSSSFGRVQRAIDGHRVTRYDRRGYGHSLPLGPPASVADQIADLVDVIDDDPALVFGHSYGGTIALATAEAHPGLVRAVVAYECPTPWMPWWPTTSAGAAAVAGSDDAESAAEAFMRRMVGDDRWARLPPSTREARRAEGPTLVAELAQLRSPHPPAFDPVAIEVPVVVAHGTEGAPHHAAAVEAIAERVSGARLEVVDGAGHGIHLTHPGEVARLVALAEAMAGSG